MIQAADGVATHASNGVGQGGAAGRFMAREWDAVERHLPDLIPFFELTPLLEVEQNAADAIRQFRAAGGPALLFPRDRQGLGASAVDAVRIQRAIGSRAPSLAIATTMHHFSVAGFVEFPNTEVRWLLLEGIARERMLLSSGAAEGRTGQGIFEPKVTARRDGDNYVIRGSKKPCSLTGSMDICVMNVGIIGDPGDPPEHAIALVPAQTPGVERRPFWGTWVLAGAESDELVFNDVVVPETLVEKTDEADPDGRYQIAGLLWFEVLITASYLGMGSALVERVIKAEKGEPVARTRIAGELEFAASAIEGVARALDDGERGASVLARALFVRHGVQRSLVQAAATATELLGGMAFIRSSEVAYLAAAVHALGFHPPSRDASGKALAAYLSGRPLVVE